MKIATCKICKKTKKEKYICPHKKTQKIISKKPTCTSKGLEEKRCKDCYKVLNSKVIGLVEHDLGKYEWKLYPSDEKNGVQIRKCKSCNYFEEKEYICPHENKEIATIKEDTCQSNGKGVEQCSLCKKRFKEINLEKLGMSIQIGLLHNMQHL